MKIALAHDHLFQIGGGEKVLKEISNMHPDAPIFTLIYDERRTGRLFKEKRIITSWLQSLPGSTQLFRFFLTAMPGIWEKTDLSNYDLVITSSSGFVKGVNVGKSAKHICYCYTPIRYLWGKGHFEEGVGTSWEGKLLKLFLPRIFDKLRTWDFEKAQKVGQFVATSQHIADKIKKHYQRSSTVIYPPVPINSFTVSDQVDDYYLIVSRLRPYKRVDLAIRAFNNLKLPLKVIGGGSELRRLKKMAKSNIEFLGEVDDITRNQYLSKCRAFIYPQVEDFGITAVEAMASGRPVLAYAKGGARETVLPGLTGEFFLDQTWESLAHCILRFDHSKYDSSAIREHATKFDTSIFRNKFALFLSNS